jgi:hypothetical protein
MTYAGAGAQQRASGWPEKSFLLFARRDLYAAWRLLTVFEAADRCVLLQVAQHTRSEDPYGLVYEVLGISKPDEPRTKPACCDSGGEPPVDADLVTRSRKAWKSLPADWPLRVTFAAIGAVDENRHRSWSDDRPGRRRRLH